jgi:hypothetical protein
VNPVGRVVGTVVEIVDGPDAGRQVSTDDHGRYVLESLEQARITVRATAEGFGSVDRTLDLASDTTLAFALSRALQASRPPAPFPVTDPEWLQRLASDYSYAHHLGNVRVFSDISPAFSAQHAEHLRLVWDFFSDLYAENRGNYVDFYYTTETEVFQKVVPYCPTIFIPGARSLTGCYLDYPRWFVIPYQVPDLGTQLHEIGHDFLFATWPPGDDGRTLWDDNKWYIEGTAMYFEGGVFEDQGSLRVHAPPSYCTSGFRRFHEQDRLLPLVQLLWRPADDFHADNVRSYSQSCMLFYYLEKHEPGVLYALIQRINSGEIVTNDNLVAALLELTGKSISELEDAYQSHAEQVSFGQDG